MCEFLAEVLHKRKLFLNAVRVPIKTEHVIIMRVGSWEFTKNRDNNTWSVNGIMLQENVEKTLDILLEKRK